MSRRSHRSSSNSYATSSASTHEPPWPSRSFLFAVNELPLNDDPAEGGTRPRCNEDGFYLPPVYSNGFHQPTPGRLYRWEEGTISEAYNYNISLLEEYKSTTLFWCNPFTQFLTAPGDASTYHIAEADPHKWCTLSFRHEGNLSRVVEVGEEAYLASRGLRWIRALGLDAYTHRESPKHGGLSGNIAAVVGLVAFSCMPEDLDDVLLLDQAWHDFRWHGHDRGDGRVGERGIVVHVYLDPGNTQGSTRDVLSQLEWGGPALLRELR